MPSLIPHWRPVEEKDKKATGYLLGTDGKIVAAVRFFMGGWHYDDYEDDGGWAGINITHVLDPALLLNLPKVRPLK